MRACTSLLAAALWVLSAAALAAQAPPVAAAIERLLDESGRAYVVAREALLERPDVVDAARAVLETTAHGPATWRSRVLAEALILHVSHPEEAERLQNLQGLDSDHYLLRRRPVPSAARELRGLRHVAPLMIELFLKGVESYRWSSPATAQAEAAALRRDLLAAIGRSDHPASVHFLTDVIAGGCACCESCNAAVVALGDTGSVQALPVVLEVLDRARREQDAEGYTAGVAALGRMRHVEVWPHLQAELRSPDPRIREAAIRSAAAYGSRWYWTADPIEGARVRAAIGSSLLDVLAETEDEGVVLAVLESLGSVATPQLRNTLERRRTARASSLRSLGPATGRAATAGDRLQRALERIDRSLARRQRNRN